MVIETIKIINKIYIFFLRIINLEIMSECGAEAWKTHNVDLQKMLSHTQSQLQDVK